jgi:hypothetical protein
LRCQLAHSALHGCRLARSSLLCQHTRPCAGRDLRGGIDRAIIDHDNVTDAVDLSCGADGGTYSLGFIVGGDDDDNLASILHS